MAWIPKNSVLARAACGLLVGASAGTVWLYNKRQVTVEGSAKFQENPFAQEKSSLGKVLASWTTNFEPSTPWNNNWDRRDPASLVKPPKNGSLDDNDYQNALKKATPTATRHLILIRHGQYNMKAEKDEGRLLTQLGREQAEYTGRRLKELNIDYKAMVNSTMSRARETADIIGDTMGRKDLPRFSCDLLREGAPIPPEPPVGNWRPEVNFFQDGARIEAAFRKYFHRADPKQEEDSYEIIVCHANVIRYFVCRALQVPPEAWLRMSLHNASITWFVIRGSGRVGIRAVGDAGHIPANKLSVT